MTDDTQLAKSWLLALRARGVTVTVRNNRLWLHPARAHGELTDAELLTLRHHRHAIKAVVSAGFPGDDDGDTRAGWKTTTVVPYTATTRQEQPASSAADRAGTRDAALRKHDPHAWLVIHGNEFEAVTSRRQQATAVMRRMVGATSPYL